VTPDDDTTRERARWTLQASAALVSAGLAPIVDELVLGDATFVTEPRMSTTTLLYAAWAALVGAAGGALAVHLALDRRSPLHVLWIATLVGILHPPLVLPQLIAHAESPVVALLGVTLMGTVVSAPAGLVFGVIFLAGLAGSRTWLAVARMFAAAGAVALVLSIPLGGSYCQLVFFVLLPALGIEPPPGTDIEWTRLVVVPAPFVLASLGAFLLARRDAARANVALEAPASAAPAPDAAP
jgi:hypothetical protein